jgi:hypothetical protein
MWIDTLLCVVPVLKISYKEFNIDNYDRYNENNRVIAWYYLRYVWLDVTCVREGALVNDD